ncbi:MAG TPA: HAMP domain-containing sensor histidine kinase, partial [Trichocoleus sp.]
MLKIFRDYWGYLTAVVVLALTFILRPDILERLLNSDGFIPHGHCYLWQPGLVWLHLASDLLTGLAYVAISATLAILVYRTRKEIPFHWMLLAFGTFIVACGSTHFMAVWTLWHPTYWLAGALKAITAFASVATAVALPALVPRSVLLVEEAKLSEERRLHLESANEKLKELDLIKTQFFANVSHELRTPLTLILGPTEKLLEETDLEAEQRRSLEVIARNARLLLKQVNDLLDVSKLEAKGMEVYPGDFDLAQLVRRTAANFDGLAQEKQVAFVVDTPDAVPVQLDEAKVERIVLNLLSNAFKFTPEGGTIRCAIATTHHANSPAEAGINPAVTITVEDSGPGIPQPLQEVIFERFRQGEGSANRRYGGTGLGLAIVKEF